MIHRLVAACVLASAAAAPGFAQDWYEPNPSLAELTADDAYARTSAQSLKTARIGPALAIRLDEAGRVLVAGWGSVARLDTDGRLDPTFGDAGVAEVPVWGDPRGLEIDAAGRIVVTGFFGEVGAPSWYSDEYTGRRYGAARLLADGSLDPAFSGDGLLELDASSGLNGLGKVHAVGVDGAMLAVAAKRGTAHATAVGGVRYDTLFGLVRFAADGTIDATYGDSGFVQLAPLAQSRDYSAFVEDFAVDSGGRALVAVQGDNGFQTVLHLDAAGGLDSSWKTYPFGYGYSAYAGWPASRLAFDGAGRLVAVEGGRFSRRLPSGTLDKTFSGDGFALNQAAHLLGLSLDQVPGLCAAEQSAPDFDSTGDPPCGGGFLAVATRADRWATARVLDYRNAKGRWVRGIEVRAIDPADPGAIVSAKYRPPDLNVGIEDLAIAPDGTAAYALGGAFVLRVDLVARRSLPLPDLRAEWIGNVRAIDLGGGRYRVSALVRIRNVSRHDAKSVIGLVSVGDAASDVALAPIPGAPNSNPFRVRARSSVVRRFAWEGGDIHTDLAGARLGIQVSCELPDADFADNTATSPPITPVYAPR